MAGIRQFADQFGASNLGQAAAGIQNQGQFSDQYAAGNLAQGASGIQNQSQFRDQFGASNLAQGAAGIQNQGQFGDQFNQNALLNAGQGLQASGQNADAFRLQALLSGAQGLQGNQQFGDQYAMSALGQGAAGLGTGAANQIQAQQGAANSLTSALGNQFQSALAGTGLQAQVGQQNTSNVMAASNSLNDAYSQERENMLNATNNAAALDQARYMDSQMLAQVGAQRDALAAAKAAEAQAAYQYEQNQAPYQALNQYLSTVGSIAGLGGTTTFNGVSKQGGGTMAGLAGALGAGASAMGGMSTGMGMMGSQGGYSSGFSQFMPQMSGQSSAGYNPFFLQNYGSMIPMTSYSSDRPW